MPTAAHWNSKENYTVPQLHRYKTRARHIQEKYLMESHVATVKTPTAAPIKLELIVHPAGEYWTVID